MAGINEKKNLCGGILGLVFWAILLTLFVQKAITVFGKAQVNVETFVQRDMSEVQINASQSSLGLLISQETQSGKIRIGYKNQTRYGFEVTMV